MFTAPRSADLLVLGGGLGGAAAALTAARLGRTVILVERGDWLGGQLTTQAVPPDEHPWVESELGSESYRELRDRIRDHYRRFFPLTEEARTRETLNPGMGNVSRLCHEPRIAALVLHEMLSPHISSGLITLLHGWEASSVTTRERRIESVIVRRGDDEVELTGAIVIDATEEGEFLELAGLPFVVGAESRAETGELHAPEQADPMDQQAVTWCAAVEYRPGEDHTIPEPAGYQHWLTTVDPRWPGPQLSWSDVVPHTLEERVRPMFADSPERAVHERADDLWHYRRVVSKAVLREDAPGGEVTIINWPQVDYWELPFIGVDADTRARAIHGARDLTLSLVHWMQTAAPRHDGGIGYPELRLRGDLTGTSDGLAKEAYIRESRRIRAVFTITEGHIGREMRGEDAGSELFDDSVGVGYYRIDLHPSTSGRNYVDIACFPFQIPLGALIPEDCDNLLAAAKNIGTTHITNGAYRLHPVEWSIGEAAAAAAVRALDTGLTPRQVRESSGELRALQRLLSDTLGATLAWPEEIRTGAESFDHVPQPAANPA